MTNGVSRYNLSQIRYFITLKSHLNLTLFTSERNATSVHVLSIHLEALVPVHDALQLASGAGGGGCIQVNISDAQAVHSILIHNPYLR